MQEKSRPPIVQCDNLIKIYKTQDIEVLALQGLELTIEYGELMAIIGNSGSGKSTFLNMIGGLDRPSAGRLIVDEKDLFKLSEQELVLYKRSTVGFVWQNNARNLLPWLSAWRNVQAPMLFDHGDRKKARALELLDMVGLSHRRHSRLSQLSGGEQQRVAIAIALANNPKLLLADEPTGAVDATTARYILDVLRKLNRELGLTVAIVTHDHMLARLVDRVVAIRDGKTSSERIIHRNYAHTLEGISSLSDGDSLTHDEYAVLDRAGRVQIPRALLEEIGVQGNRVKMHAQDGRIVIDAPRDVGTDA